MNTQKIMNALVFSVPGIPEILIPNSPVKNEAGKNKIDTIDRI